MEFFQKSAFHSFLIWGELNLYKKMSDKILLSHTEKNTDLLGPYRRFVIWVHGCCFDCEGCLAESTKNGAYTETDIKELAQEILSSETEGITISGGEPFLQAKALFELVSLLKSIKDIGVIIYSGFTLEELQENEENRDLLTVTDILIDGRYMKELDDGKAYIGSSNQHLYYLSDRYKDIGQEYYSADKRRAEIKFTLDKAVLIGVPSKNVLNVWQKVKEKSGGDICDF